jgi:hypothetical protein
MGLESLVSCLPTEIPNLGDQQSDTTTAAELARIGVADARTLEVEWEQTTAVMAHSQAQNIKRKQNRKHK